MVMPPKKERPLHLSDIDGSPHLVGRPQHTWLGHAWFWCRRHERPEPINWAMTGCLRIGPFMSEQEASQCTGLGMVWRPEDVR